MTNYSSIIRPSCGAVGLFRLSCVLAPWHHISALYIFVLGCAVYTVLLVVRVAIHFRWFPASVFPGFGDILILLSSLLCLRELRSLRVGLRLSRLLGLVVSAIVSDLYRL